MGWLNDVEVFVRVVQTGNFTATAEELNMSKSVISKAFCGCFGFSESFESVPFFHSLALLGSVIKQEYRPMLSALAVIAILMLFAAAGIYLLEREGQPETFGDLPSALWWVVVTLSTVGYGDAVPLTWLGRGLGAVIMILGIGMVVLPAGMLASRFSEVMHR